MNSLKRHIVSESTLISNSSSVLPGLNKYEHARRKAEYANYPDHNGSIKVTSAVVDGRLGGLLILTGKVQVISFFASDNRWSLT